MGILLASFWIDRHRKKKKSFFGNNADTAKNLAQIAIDYQTEAFTRRH